MKEQLRFIFREWCKEEKLIVKQESENKLIDEIFNLVRARIGK